MTKKLKVFETGVSAKASKGLEYEFIDTREISGDIEEWELKAFLRVVSAELSPEQEDAIVNPGNSFHLQQDVLAVHWHPEHIPFTMLKQRIAKLYPDATNTLIIPTQHNTLLEFDGYAGLEIDCYSPEFDRKVQLLLHFTSEKALAADKIRVMAEHTFKYRSKQLFEILHTLTEPALDGPLYKAMESTEAGENIVGFVKIYAGKLIKLIEENEGSIKPDFIKNKIIRDFFDELREVYDGHVINLSQIFIKAVKENVKAVFSPKYFYKTQDVISEARLCGGGIVVPHPEQFWPILLADYDVDGFEVWNPQSRQYTEFLTGVVARNNKGRKNQDRPLLVFMGDDTHMGEKIKKPSLRDPDKASREIGMQPAWDDLDIRQALKDSRVSRAQTINEYRQRLDQA